MIVRVPAFEPSGSVRDALKDYYGRVLERSGDLKTDACTCSDAPPAWLKDLLANVHDDVAARFYGCGYPIPAALDGTTVLDLGCGTGRDVYVLSQLVGLKGMVHGVDMTATQLAVAREAEAWHRRRFGYPTSNVRFHEGYIEDLASLGVETASIDVVVSNCVVNLSPRKDMVLSEVLRVLKPGGEFYLSDVVCDRRLPDAVAEDPVLHAECLGGAMYQGDFESLCRDVGFRDPRVMASSGISIENQEIKRRVGAAGFRSTTYRLLKIEDLDERCEDYGQLATYLGTVPHHEALFWLDDHHAFEAMRPERVCRNTASMLSQTRFAPHFDVTDAGTHYGAFPCGPTLVAQQHGGAVEATSGCC